MYGIKILGAEAWITVDGKKHFVNANLYEKDGHYNYHENWHLGRCKADPEHSTFVYNLSKEEAILKIKSLRDRNFFYQKSYMFSAPNWIKDAWF